MQLVLELSGLGNAHYEAVIAWRAAVVNAWQVDIPLFQVAWPKLAEIERAIWISRWTPLHRRKNHEGLERFAELQRAPSANQIPVHAGARETFFHMSNTVGDCHFTIRS